MNSWRRFNQRLAELLADIISTMPLFYICNIFIISCLFIQPPSSVPAWANFISSNWFQLVALPVLAIANRVDMSRMFRLHQQELKLIREEMQILKKLCER